MPDAFIGESLAAFCKILKTALYSFGGLTGKKQAEFITSVSSDDGVLREECLHAGGQILQNLVAGRMTIHVIDKFEIIDIQFGNDAGSVRVLLQVAIEHLIKAVPVVNIRQIVGYG